MKLKIVRLISVITLFVTFAGFAGNITGESVEAASFAQRNHLRPFVIPKKFRGTWHRGKEVLHVRKRKYYFGSTPAKSLTYYNKWKLKKNMKGSGKVVLVQKYGKELDFFSPQACGMGMYRRGNKLVMCGQGCKFVYHK